MVFGGIEVEAEVGAEEVVQTEPVQGLEGSGKGIDVVVEERVLAVVYMAEEERHYSLEDILWRCRNPHVEQGVVY